MIINKQWQHQTTTNTASEKYFHLIKSVFIIICFASIVYSIAGGTIIAFGESNTDWIENAPMPVPVGAFGYAVVNEKIYIIGGDSSGSSINTVQRYDPATDTWEADTNHGGTLSPLPAPRAVLYCGVINGKIHAIGGWEQGAYKGDHFIYDPQSNTWSVGPSIPQYPIGQFAATINNKIYVFGGWSGNYKDLVIEYSDESGWSYRSPMPTARNHGTTAVYNGQIYVMGGETQYQKSDVVEMYNPETDTWTTGLTPMPSPQHWLGSSGSPVSNGIIYVIGPSDTVYAYNLQADSWGTFNPMPSDAYGVTVINGLIYAIGNEHTFQESTPTPTQTSLSLTKSASPYSIKQSQTTTITLTVKNNGTTEITDIEVSDTIPSDMIFISGETSRPYTSLKPNDSREFQYIIQLNEAGTYNLDPATATYADEEGNYHMVKSKNATIEVIPYLSTTLVVTPTPTSNKISPFTVTITSEPATIELNKTSTIIVAVTENDGVPISGASVMLATTNGGKTSSLSGTTGSFGQFTSNFTGFSVGDVTIKTLVRKEGFSDGYGETTVKVIPINNQTVVTEETVVPNQTVQTDSKDPINWLKIAFLLLVVVLVLIILVIAVAVIYLWTKDNLQLVLVQTSIPCDGKSSLPIKVMFTNFFGIEKRQKKDREVELETTSGDIKNVSIPKGEIFTEATLKSSNKCGSVTITGKSNGKVATADVKFTEKRYCMHCGTQMTMEAQFCPKCEMTPPSGDQTKQCSTCDITLPQTAMFCNKCGAKQPKEN